MISQGLLSDGRLEGPSLLKLTACLSCSKGKHNQGQELFLDPQVSILDQLVFCDSLKVLSDEDPDP